MHPTKTRIVDATRPGAFDFLGYHFERGYSWQRRKSLQKFKDTFLAKTRRTHGQCLATIVADRNRRLQGGLGYFQHSHRSSFVALDVWVRMRVRSILRYRQGRQKRSRGRDHQRWPNAFFTQQGLFSLVTAAAVVVNPLAGETTD